MGMLQACFLLSTICSGTELCILCRLPLVSADAQQGLHLIFISSAQLGKLRDEGRQIQCSAVSMCASSAQFERSLTGLKSSVVSLTGIAGLRQYRHNSWVYRNAGFQ